ncbi:MAG: hypothetical protein ABDH21_01415, partial [bacterium]
LAINSNGEIFVAGNSIGLQDQSIVLFKLNSQGQLDTSFGNNGYLILNDIAGIGAEDVANDMIIDRFGRLFIVGTSRVFPATNIRGAYFSSIALGDFRFFAVRIE